MTTTAKLDWFQALEEMLDHCSYPEDVEALSHFAFHPRMNHCSNVCTLCHYGICDFDSPDDHGPDCAYARALVRTAECVGELQAYIDNY